MENIAISGFSGSGKTVVGKNLSQKLGWDFIDTDDEIESREAKSIPDIFKEKGESYFRYLEKEVISSLRYCENTVISLGGGALVDDKNLYNIRDNSFLVTLWAEPEIILKRIRNAMNRPLIADAPEQRVIELLKEREKRYRVCDLLVKTDNITPEEAAEKIKEKYLEYKKKKIVKTRVNLGSNSYDVIIGSDILSFIPEEAKKRCDFRKCLIITSKPILQYKIAKKIKDAFSDYQCEIYFLTLPEGERTKDIKYAIRIWDFMANKKFRRNDIIVALGGGVIGDLAGFSASVWTRGINYVQVPTTLLSQVDSSIGGKTGVNIEKAKNMIGTITQPASVICDINFLKTLSKRDFLSGLGEVAKYGISLSKRIYDFVEKEKSNLMRRDGETMKKLISMCADIKAKVVSQDEYETKNIRFLLNFGHTVGHALESASGYKLTHGEAISVGMVKEAEISEKILGKTGLSDQVKDFLRGLGLPTSIKIKDYKKFLSSFELDKKTRDEEKTEINFNLLEDIGKSRIVRISLQEIQSMLE